MIPSVFSDQKCHWRTDGVGRMFCWHVKGHFYTENWYEEQIHTKHLSHGHRQSPQGRGCSPSGVYKSRTIFLLWSLPIILIDFPFTMLIANRIQFPGPDLSCLTLCSKWRPHHGLDTPSPWADCVQGLSVMETGCPGGSGAGLTNEKQQLKKLVPLFPDTTVTARG